MHKKGPASRRKQLSNTVCLGGRWSPVKPFGSFAHKLHFPLYIIWWKERWSLLPSTPDTGMARWRKLTVEIFMSPSLPFPPGYRLMTAMCRCHLLFGSCWNWEPRNICIHRKHGKSIFRRQYQHPTIPPSCPDHHQPQRV